MSLAAMQSWSEISFVLLPIYIYNLTLSSLHFYTRHRIIWIVVDSVSLHNLDHFAVSTMSTDNKPPSEAKMESTDDRQENSPSPVSSATSSCYSKSPVDIFAILCPKPGNLQRILEVTEIVGHHSKEHEPGCFKYLVYLQKNAEEGCEKKVYLSQHFANERAFVDHLQSEPHVKVITELVEQDLLTENILHNEVCVRYFGGFDRAVEYQEESKTHSGNENDSTSTSEQTAAAMDLISRTATADAVDIISVLDPQPNIYPGMHQDIQQNPPESPQNGIHNITQENPQDSILRACQDVAAYARLEPGCDKFLVFRQWCPPPKARNVILIERYRDQEAFKAHLKADIVVKAMNDCEENLLEKPIDVETAYVELIWGFEREYRKGSEADPEMQGPLYDEGACARC